jgi:hypothetical protein
MPQICVVFPKWNRSSYGGMPISILSQQCQLRISRTFVTKFGTRTDEQQISPFAPIRLREMALVEMKGCGVLACAECLRWRRREVMISTARVREVGEYSVGEYRMTSPSHDRPC